VGVLGLSGLTALDLWVVHRRRRLPSKVISLQASGSADDGIAMFYSSRFCRLLRALLLATVCVVATFAGAVILGWAAPSPTSPPDADSFLVGGAVLSLLVTWAVWMVWVVVEIAGRRVARGRLVLSPDGIYHRSFTFEHFAPWHAVVDVSARHHGNPLILVRAFPTDDTLVRRTAWLGKQSEFALLPFLVVRCRSLAVDPAVAYHALRYYHAHPEARGELRTVAGEQRIRSGDLLD
jgi:hypothetical protein